ncbi:MAG TPA: SDR family oxidoreductase [Oligoflexus sp.]|uniref:SDR family NAD(P)-dependent oxidoreductase n=1 Tax=Oligoflexus sp. TaxID=1971216 RepID=UPI002D446DDB|nr:SDR family oxidoreductase [Oligoflexus sp.]HYX39643.1 SDR family oxidoreductase [Oligoflexus sp.]
MNLAGKRIVVTGAGSGIGRALVLELLKLDGVRVLGVDLNISGIPASPQVATLACDLSAPDGTDRAIQKAQSTMGGIDIYFANAGFAYYEKLGSADWARLQRIYATNVMTPIYTFQKVRDLAAGQPFRVVVTASAMGYLPIPGYAVYGATKASIVSFSQALRWVEKDQAVIFPSLIFRLTLVFNRILPLVGWVYQMQQDWVLKRWHAAMRSVQADKA